MPAVVTAPYEIVTEKLYQGEYFTNRYYCNAGTMADAVATAQSLVNFERQITYSPIIFTKTNVRSTAKLDFVYKTLIINQNGAQAMGAGDEFLALFNVLRIDMEAASGRPSRKYYRGCLTEGGANFNGVRTETRAAAQTIATNLLPGLAFLCGPQGEQLVNFVVHPNVGMRQLRRGSKKKKDPSSPGTTA